VSQRLARLEADTSGRAIAGLAGADQQAAIRGMVEGLAERLKASGGTSRMGAPDPLADSARRQGGSARGGC
jgi:hypothetical protein